ncbi:helix-turn-helix domain-containing protein [Oscillibacter sp. MSJ-2]|uniref:Helix-turn-helix domain-containing protein n=1 Tax=Dysosmobacter acutus TaxID=2841504 RepID=A0ABS6F787_9FIRM|nr:helix-turn-helix domain-containing protein [Dysosmobacter acutus]MBU5626148.1 helix-turn-helix domain-containing protein [Dysosmobacter acutus]
MTVGERITQHRKNQQLSQESLGEALGVSRQAISKWESDATLPEVEKLVAMSRLFHVPVGVLLGVEEAQPEEPSQLDERQLAMVEEIVSRYLNVREGAQKSQTARQNRKQGLFALAVLMLACAVLLGAYRNLKWKIDGMGDEFRENIERVKSSVEIQMDSLAGRVEDILRAQNQLTAVYAVEREAVDVGADTITFRLSATPKTFEPGMKATFVAESSGTTEQAAQGEGPDFSAELTCPLSDSIALSVCFQRGETLETQLLEVVTGAERGTMLYCSSASYDRERPGGVPEGGLFCIGRNEVGASFSLYDPAYSDAVYAQGAEIGYFVNSKPAFTMEAGPAVTFSSGGDDFEVILPETCFPVEEGDIIVLGAVATDNFSRQFRWAPWACQVKEGELRVVEPPAEWAQ